MGLRNPNHTGENRCWPCTAVNLFAICLLSVGIALVGSGIGAVFVGAIGVGAIWMRGYAVPGTPRFTRHLPTPVLQMFGKDAPSSRRSTDIVQVLSRAELLVDSGEDPSRLTNEAREAYETRARELVSDRELLEDAVVESFHEIASISVNRGLGGDEIWFAKDVDGNTAMQWEARPIVAMDVAGAERLADRVDGWEQYEPRKRRQAYAVLRQGASTCPTCGDEFKVDDSQSVVCCGGRSLTGAVRCQNCNYAVVDTSDLPTQSSDADTDFARAEL